jgi:hypothetical protein
LQPDTAGTAPVFRVDHHAGTMRGAMGRTSDAKIVEEIVEHLRPWRRREAEVEADIHHEIGILRKFIPLQARLFDRSAIKKSALEFGAAIAEVEKCHIHGWVIWRLFGEPPPELHWDEGEDVYFYRDKRPFDEIEQAYFDRVAHFQNELKRLRVECEKMARNPGGAHSNADWGKSTCAKVAHMLILHLSKEKPTGSEDRPFRAIAGLLYQAISGEKADLERACDKVLALERGPRKKIDARKS